VTFDLNKHLERLEQINVAIAANNIGDIQALITATPDMLDLSLLTHAILQSANIAWVQTYMTAIHERVDLPALTRAILESTNSVHIQIYITALHGLDEGASLRKLSKAMFWTTPPSDDTYAYAATTFSEKSDEELDQIYDDFLSLDGEGIEWVQACAGAGNLQGVLFGLSLINQLSKNKPESTMQACLDAILHTALNAQRMSIAQIILEFAYNLEEENLEEENLEEKTFDALLIHAIEHLGKINTSEEAKIALFLLSADRQRPEEHHDDVKRVAIPATLEKKLVSAFFSREYRLANLVQLKHTELIFFAAKLSLPELEQQLSTCSFIRDQSALFQQGSVAKEELPATKLAEIFRSFQRENNEETFAEKLIALLSLYQESHESLPIFLTLIHVIRQDQTMWQHLAIIEPALTPLIMQVLKKYYPAVHQEVLVSPPRWLMLFFMDKVVNCDALRHALNQESPTSLAALLTTDAALMRVAQYLREQVAAGRESDPTLVALYKEKLFALKAGLSITEIRSKHQFNPSVKININDLINKHITSLAPYTLPEALGVNVYDIICPPGPEAQSFLSHAVSKNATAFVELLIAQKVDVNHSPYTGGATPLMEARSPKVADLLINADAKLDAQNSKGETALMLAANRGHIEVVRCLIAANADLNIQDEHGRTALIKAVNHSVGRREIAQLLINAGAQLDIQDEFLNTALMRALDPDGRLREEETPQLLIRSGAKLDIRNKDRKTALDLVNQHNSKTTVAKLVQKCTVFDAALIKAKTPLKEAVDHIRRHYSDQNMATAKILAERAINQFATDPDNKAECIQAIRDAGSINAVLQAMKPKPKIETLINGLKNYIAEKKPIHEGWQKWWGFLTNWFSILEKKITIAERAFTALNKLNTLQKADDSEPTAPLLSAQETHPDLATIITLAKEQNANSLHWYQKCFFDIDSKSKLQGILNGEEKQQDRPKNTS